MFIQREIGDQTHVHMQRKNSYMEVNSTPMLYTED